MENASLIGNRVNTRFQILNCKVQLKTKGVLGRFGKKTHHLSLVNLSTTGLQAISLEPLKNRKEYNIALMAPAYPKPIFAKGRVMWQKPHKTDTKKQCYRVALEFTYFKTNTIKRIQHLERNPHLRGILEDQGDYLYQSNHIQ